MAVKDYCEPYAKHVFEPYILQNAFTNRFTDVSAEPYGEYSRPTSVLTGGSARDVEIPDQYQKNVFVSNDTIERLVEASKPSYVGGAFYPEPIVNQKNPLYKYSSIGQ